MKKITSLTIIYLFVSFVGLSQDTALVWSLSSDTSCTFSSLANFPANTIKGKGERFGNKLNNITYANSYQKIHPPSSGWSQALDTTPTNESYIDFPFRLHPDFYNLGCQFSPFLVNFSAYLGSNDSVKLNVYLYDSSLYYDSTFYPFTKDSSRINSPVGQFPPYYFTYLNGYWWYHDMPNWMSGNYNYDSSKLPHYNAYDSIAHIMKMGTFLVTSTNISTPDTCTNYPTTLQQYLNINKSIHLGNDKVVFARVYITSNNSNTVVNIKNFTVGGESGCILPINFKSFTALKKNDKVQLNWSLENEINIEKYVVEKANKNDVFETMSTVLSTKNKDYTSVDETLNKGINTFRIKAIAQDGKATYSSIVKVLFDDKKAAIAIYPNPVKNVLSVEMLSTKNEMVTIQITDLQCKILQQKEQQLQVGNNAFSMNTSSLAKGIYVLTIKSNTNQIVKFIKE